MPCKINNPANYQMGEFESHIHGMYDHFESKYGFKKPPTLFLNSEPSNQSKVLGKTAYYDPSSQEVVVFITNRHTKDVLRSIAHELVHHMQNLRGDFDDDMEVGEGYAQKNPKNEFKQEAYSMFEFMLDEIDSETVRALFSIELVSKNTLDAIKQKENQEMKLEKPDSQKTDNQNARENQLIEKAPIREQKFGRNQIVKITNGREKVEMKYKKAQPLIESGAFLSKTSYEPATSKPSKYLLPCVSRRSDSFPSSTRFLKYFATDNPSVISFPK